MTRNAIGYAAIMLTIAGGLAPAVPAGAATLADTGYAGRDNAGASTGQFAGLRARLALGGGAAGATRFRAGLTLTATHGAPGRRGYGDGLEIGFTGGQRAPRLTFGGYGFAPGRAAGPDGRRLGLSPLGIAGIVVGAAVAAVGIGYIILRENAEHCSPDCS
ncbi:hypothetical protein [Sphingomonas flavalba]|uniref:hypothetical protein n=1 Tax=Sphingomonas flavalba TaxID=2559804 RepID=UPI00109DA100|nr:hypothetical protein [Sphingomonas flavalba]